MRTTLWPLLLASVLAAACGDDVHFSTGDAGGDNGPESDSGAPDSGPPDAAATEQGNVCADSELPGCVSYCSQVRECVVLSGIAASVRGVAESVGFDLEDKEDCSGCLAQCEQAVAADAGDADDEVLRCFDEMAIPMACSVSADPTTSANLIQACCTNHIDNSGLCAEVCGGVLLNAMVTDLIPVCDALPNTVRAPRCHGECPEVEEALVLPISGDGIWHVDRAAFASDGRIALNLATDAVLEIGGEAVMPSLGAAQVVSVHAADGAPLWHRFVAEDFDEPSTAIVLPSQIDFDADGNLYLVTRLSGSTDLGGGELEAEGPSDALIISWDPDGALRWAVQFGGEGSSRASALWIGTDRMLVVGSFENELLAGTGTFVGGDDSDMFLAELSLTGELRWVRTYGGSGSDLQFNITGLPDGGLAIAGILTDGADLGDGPLDIDNAGRGTVARFDADGGLVWLRQNAGGLCYQIATFHDDLLTQCFSTVDGEFAGETYAESTQVLTRWAPGGSPVPFENFGDGSGFSVAQLVAHPDGGLLVTVGAGLDSDLGGGVLHANADIGMARYGEDGGHRWSTTMGGVRAESIAAAHYDARGRIEAVINIDHRLDYGPGTLETGGLAAAVLRLEAE